MKPTPVSVINKSKIVTNSDVVPVVAALQSQVSEHLAPRWHIDAVLDFVPAGKNVPSSNWRLEILDDTDIPPDSGYHNVGSDGIPYGRVFVNTSRQYKENWTITASHELLEMLVNPYAVFAAYVPFDDNTGTFYNLEICDPVSPDVNGYKINGIGVSDFVFPEWFSPFLAVPASGQTKQVDYCKRLPGPAPAIVPATTVSVFGWRNLQSQMADDAARIGKDVASLLNKGSIFGTDS
jgi:hypothetical protein